MGNTKTPQEVLREAAIAAESLIPQVDRQREEARAHLARLDAQSMQLKAIVSAAANISQSSRFSLTPSYANLSVSIPATSTSSTAVTTTTTSMVGAPVAVSREATSVPTTADKVELVIQAAGRPLSTREISEALQNMEKRTIPMSSIYYALMRARQTGRLKSTGGLWSPVKSEGQG